jgi:hypothetical protein
MQPIAICSITSHTLAHSFMKGIKIQLIKGVK